MRRNECGQSRCTAGATVGKLAVIALVVLTAATLVHAAPKNDKDQELTQIYQHTYDEVFQAAQDAIERMGLSLTDKDKGMISGKGRYVFHSIGGILVPGTWTFDIHIETLNAKPEVRVTINARREDGHTYPRPRAAVTASRRTPCSPSSRQNS